MLEQAPDRSCDPMERKAHDGAECEELQHLRRTHTGELPEEVSHERNLTLEQGKGMSSPTPEGEVAEEMGEEQNASPVPSPHALFWRRSTRN